MTKTHRANPRGITISPLAFVVGYLSISAVGYFVLIVFHLFDLEFKFGLDAAQIVKVVGGLTFFGAIFSWAGGALADRFSAQKVLLIAALLYALSAIIMGLADTLELFMLAVLVFGLSRILWVPANKAIFAQADDATGGAFRLRFIVLSLAYLCVIALSLLVPSSKFDDMFWLAALLFALAFLWCLVFRFEGDARSKPSAESTQGATTVDKGERWQAIVFVIAMGFFLFVIVGQMETVLPVFLINTFSDEGIAIYRQELMVAGACAPIFAIANHQIRARRRGLTDSRMVLFAFVLQIVGVTMLFAGPSASWIYVGAATFAAAWAILAPMIDGLASPLTRSDNRGRIMGILEFRELAFLISPVVGGWLLDHHQAWLLPFLLVTSVLMLIAYFFAKKASARVTLADENASPPLTSLH